jgi:hypothetical protein
MRVSSAPGQRTPNAVIVPEPSTIEEDEENMPSFETMELQKFFYEAGSVETQTPSRYEEILWLSRRILRNAIYIYSREAIKDKALQTPDGFYLLSVTELMRRRRESQS